MPAFVDYPGYRTLNCNYNSKESQLLGSKICGWWMTSHHGHCVLLSMLRIKTYLVCPSRGVACLLVAFWRVKYMLQIFCTFYNTVSGLENPRLALLWWYSIFHLLGTSKYTVAHGHTKGVIQHFSVVPIYGNTDFKNYYSSSLQSPVLKW